MRPSHCSFAYAFALMLSVGVVRSRVFVGCVGRAYAFPISELLLCLYDGVGQGFTYGNASSYTGNSGTDYFSYPGTAWTIQDADGICRNDGHPVYCGTGRVLAYSMGTDYILAMRALNNLLTDPATRSAGGKTAVYIFTNGAVASGIEATVADMGTQPHPFTTANMHAEGSPCNAAQILITDHKTEAAAVALEDHPSRLAQKECYWAALQAEMQSYSWYNTSSNYRPPIAEVDVAVDLRVLAVGNAAWRAQATLDILGQRETQVDLSTFANFATDAANIVKSTVAETSSLRPAECEVLPSPTHPCTGCSVGVGPCRTRTIHLAPTLCRAVDALTGQCPYGLVSCPLTTTTTLVTTSTNATAAATSMSLPTGTTTTESPLGMVVCVGRRTNTGLVCSCASDTTCHTCEWPTDAAAIDVSFAGKCLVCRNAQYLYKGNCVSREGCPGVVSGVEDKGRTCDAPDWLTTGTAATRLVYVTVKPNSTATRNDNIDTTTLATSSGQGDSSASAAVVIIAVAVLVGLCCLLLCVCFRRNSEDKDVDVHATDEDAASFDHVTDGLTGAHEAVYERALAQETDFDAIYDAAGQERRPVYEAARQGSVGLEHYGDYDTAMQSHNPRAESIYDTGVVSYPNINLGGLIQQANQEPRTSDVLYETASNAQQAQVTVYDTAGQGAASLVADVQPLYDTGVKAYPEINLGPHAADTVQPLYDTGVKTYPNISFGPTPEGEQPLYDMGVASYPTVNVDLPAADGAAQPVYDTGVTSYPNTTVSAAGGQPLYDIGRGGDADIDIDIDAIAEGLYDTSNVIRYSSSSLDVADENAYEMAASRRVSKTLHEGAYDFAGKSLARTASTGTLRRGSTSSTATLRRESVDDPHVDSGGIVVRGAMSFTPPSRTAGMRTGMAPLHAYEEVRTPEDLGPRRSTVLHLSGDHFLGSSVNTDRLPQYEYIDGEPSDEDEYLPGI